MTMNNQLPVRVRRVVVNVSHYREGAFGLVVYCDTETDDTDVTMELCALIAEAWKNKLFPGLSVTATRYHPPLRSGSRVCSVGMVLKGF